MIRIYLITLCTAKSALYCVKVTALIVSNHAAHETARYINNYTFNDPREAYIITLLVSLLKSRAKYTKRIKRYVNNVSASNHYETLDCCGTSGRPTTSSGSTILHSSFLLEAGRAKKRPAKY